MNALEIMYSKKNPILMLSNVGEFGTWMFSYHNLELKPLHPHQHHQRIQKMTQV